MTLDDLCREVHNDVYKVIKHWVGTTESAEKLLDIWTTFVETFFGLPLRPKEEQVGRAPIEQTVNLSSASSSITQTVLVPACDSFPSIRLALCMGNFLPMRMSGSHAPQFEERLSIQSTFGTPVWEKGKQSVIL